MKNTIKNGFAGFLLLMLVVVMTLASCTDDCTSCTLNEETTEVCLDGEITYTDIDGNALPDDEVVAYLESIGYDCN